MLKNKETYEIMDAESIGLAKVRPSVSVDSSLVCLYRMVGGGRQRLGTEYNALAAACPPVSFDLYRALAAAADTDIIHQPPSMKPYTRTSWSWGSTRAGTPSARG